jgi:hypothetical protein
MAEQGIVDTVLNRKSEASITERVWGSIEGVYDSLGLMEGSTAPAKRMIFTGGLASGVVYAIKPSSAFDSRGARPWILTSPGDPRATTSPWWIWAVAGAIFGGFFV